MPFWNVFSGKKKICLLKKLSQEGHQDNNQSSQGKNILSKNTITYWIRIRIKLIRIRNPDN